MIKEQFSRNLGILSENEINKLQDTKIVIAGCGCIGGFSAELLTRMGVGKLALADPDVFDVSNINRQCSASFNTVGQLKVDALSDHLLAINPDLEITRFRKGVNEENMDEFLEDADYVIDAIDYFCFPDAITLHRAARKKDLYIITAVALGFGASVLTFAPDGMSIEKYIGIQENLSIDQLKGITFPASQYASYLPSYVNEEMIEEFLEKKTIPTISVGQALGPGALVSQLVLHLLERKQPLLVPDKFQLQFE